MRKIIINGGKKLQGEVTVSGAKNSVVALIPAIILSDGVVTLDGVPAISDVDNLIEIIEVMGGSVKRDGETLEIDPRGVKDMPMPFGKINSLRASYYFYGSLLGRYGQATVGLPGGCDLGPRPIDLHLKAFEAMGASISYEAESMRIATDAGQCIKGAHIYMDTVSVGATINTMLAAAKAEGRTVIENAAREPEIIDVATLLNNMGARVRGAGTEVITIEGVESLHGTRHQVIPDRIEAGSYIAMAAAIGKGVKVKNVLYEHLESFIAKLEAMGVRMTVEEDAIFVEEQGDLKPVEINTTPYPGFATDLQQPLTALLTQANGQSQVIETIYPERFRHCEQLNKMGANIELDESMCYINGKTPLKGAKVEATDLRCGAALLIAGLIADGITEISNVYHIDRGYANIDQKLITLGAVIRRIKVDD